ncbi:hypothetical protein LCGC14_0461930 [marine sediment metagenome]|uniref:Uncharacterized protein n=1 Tax=marine sediment metagenome TaxID=412755 RepID=A0A0F9SJY2_9ZZZZ
MFNWVLFVLIIIGILLILVYPKIIKWFLLLVVAYLTIFENWYYGVLYIPLLLLMLYYKRRKEKYG